MRAAAVTAVLFVCAGGVQADVIIHSRSTEFRSSYMPGQVLPGFTGFNDYAYVNQLRPSGSGVVDLATFHNEHFTSTASPTQISARMLGDWSYGGNVDRTRSSHSSSFSVVFEVSESAAAATIGFNGSITPQVFDTSNAGFTFRIINLTTGQTAFDVFGDTPPPPALRHAEWDHVAWSGLLEPGMYVLITQAHAESFYDIGANQGGYGFVDVSFSMTFGPGVAPALAPSPSAAALLALAMSAALRRRR